ncbi:hypothetical protein BH10CHL1_BH10CHL1_40080 [soil metagenome]
MLPNKTIPITSLVHRTTTTWLLTLLTWSLGLLCFAWALLDPRFRDLEGYVTGVVCLPIAAGVALLIVGMGIRSGFKQTVGWLALALVGQAVALQLIHAGPALAYQHYQAFNQLTTGLYPWLLAYLLLQAVLVTVGLRKYWPQIRHWLFTSFKIWQLGGLGLIFFLSSAALSRDVKFYAAELLFASFVQLLNLANIILLVWTLPAAELGFLTQWFERFLGQAISWRTQKKASQGEQHIDFFIVATALWTVGLTALLSYFAYERHPHVPDEVIYLFHARYLAKGLLSIPAPAIGEAFSIYMTPYKAMMWYSPVPPGWPAILALGVLVGAPWLVNPVLSGLSLILSYICIKELYDKQTARIATFLLCVSPWYIFMGMSFMSHTFTLTCGLVALTGMIGLWKSGRARWAWLAGGAVGMISLIRPLDGLLVAMILGLWVISIGRRRLKLSSLVALGCGVMVIGAFALPYNWALTGNPFLFPLTAYYDQYFWPNVMSLGFGPDRGFNWPIDPFPGHSPLDAFVNGGLNLFSLNIELLGWSTGSLLLVAFALVSKSMRRTDYLFFAVMLVNAGMYSLFWYSGGPDFGARYWYLMIIPLIILTVRSIQFLSAQLLASFPTLEHINTRLMFAVLALSVLALVTYFPWRAIDKYHHFRGMRPGIVELAEKYKFGRSLVLVRGNEDDYQSTWIYNPLNYKADVPLYAWDKKPELREALVNAYGDRPIWIVDGPSISQRGFVVIKGPLSAYEFQVAENPPTSK